MASKVIALDVMGGDHGPRVVIPAALKALQEEEALRLILVGDQDIIRQHLGKHNAIIDERIKVHHSTQTVAMDESPALALRNKKDSSMRVAIDLVKAGEAHACVSAGNTGALMATAKFVLKTLPGIHRPAILARLPTRRGLVRMVDLGANVDCSAEHLFQFAVMGSVVAEAVGNVHAPKVGLLNIGAEDIKGNEQVKQTAELLNDIETINYTGFVEGNDIYSGVVDVVVCDGFVGNVALKTSEGLAKLIAHFIRRGFSRNWLTKIAGLLAYPVLKSLQESIDPARHNGATFVGLNGIVVKSHGSANVLAYACAIHEAVLEVENRVPQRISEKVTKLLQKAEVS